MHTYIYLHPHKQLVKGLMNELGPQHCVHLHRHRAALIGHVTHKVNEMLYEKHSPGSIAFHQREQLKAMTGHDMQLKRIGIRA